MRRRSSKPPTIPAVDAGLRLLARRAHSKLELRQKLRRRGYDEAEVDAVVARLGAAGYLDDAVFAAGHIRRRSRSLGPLALSAELAARGVDRELASSALSGFGTDEQLASATALAGRLAGRKAFAGYRELLDSVGPKLVRRGFSVRVAREACRALWKVTPTTPEAEASPPPV